MSYRFLANWTSSLPVFEGKSQLDGSRNTLLLWTSMPHFFVGGEWWNSVSCSSYNPWWQMITARISITVDIWSLGCTIIEMLSGKPPWSEFERTAAMFKVMRSALPIPEMLSVERKDLLQCCFLRQPAKRPSAAMLLEHAFLQIWGCRWLNFFHVSYVVAKEMLYCKCSYLLNQKD